MICIVLERSVPSFYGSSGKYSWSCFFFNHFLIRELSEWVFDIRARPTPARDVCWDPSFSIRRRLKDKEGEAVVRQSSWEWSVAGQGWV